MRTGGGRRGKPFDGPDGDNPGTKGGSASSETAVRTAGRPRSVVGAILGVFALFSLVGCSDDKGDDEASPSDASSLSTDVTDASSGSTTTTSTTAAPSSDPATLAKAAYQKSWDVSFAASNPANPDHPGLAEVLTGTALEDARTFINGLVRKGGRVEGRMEAHSKVVSENSSQVVLDECSVEHSTEYDGNGAVVDTAEGSVFHYTVTVVNEGGTWKVATFVRLEDTCVPG